MSYALTDVKWVVRMLRRFVALVSGVGVLSSVLIAIPAAAAPVELPEEKPVTNVAGKGFQAPETPAAAQVRRLEAPWPATGEAQVTVTSTELVPASNLQVRMGRSSSVAGKAQQPIKARVKVFDEKAAKKSRLSAQ